MSDPELPDERCHCGRPANGHIPDLCEHCSSVRCDAFPGECKGSPGEQAGSDSWQWLGTDR